MAYLLGIKLTGGGGSGDEGGKGHASIASVEQRIHQLRKTGRWCWSR